MNGKRTKKQIIFDENQNKSSKERKVKSRSAKRNLFPAKDSQLNAAEEKKTVNQVDSPVLTKIVQDKMAEEVKKSFKVFEHITHL